MHSPTRPPPCPPTRAGGKLDVCGRVPVMDVEVADTTGAGDSYLSGGRAGGWGGRAGVGTRHPLPPSRQPCAPSHKSSKPPPPPPPAGFIFYMLLAGGLDALVADPEKVGGVG